MGRDFDVSIASGECNCSCSWDVHKLHDHECKSAVEAAGGERLETKFFVLVFAAMPSSTMDERMALIEEEKEANYSKLFLFHFVIFGSCRAMPTPCTLFDRLYSRRALGTSRRAWTSKCVMKNVNYFRSLFMLQLPVSQFEVVNTCFPADSRFPSRLLSWTRESEKQFFFTDERLFFYSFVRFLPFRFLFCVDLQL